MVIVPKYRKRVLYGKLKQDVGEILRDLTKQKGIELLEGHLMPDYVHMCLKIPPKYSVAFALGFMEGKSVVSIHRKAGYKKVTGMHFWSRGYCVSTVGLDEETIKKYIREQEKQEEEQLEWFDEFKKLQGRLSENDHITGPLRVTPFFLSDGLGAFCGN